VRLPFSYKRSFFSTILAFSFIGHAAFLLGAGLVIAPSPRFGVEEAPSSVELVFVEETREPERVEKPEEILVIKELPPEAPEIPQKKPVEKKQEESRKPVYIPPVRGALIEANPAYLRNPAPLYPLIARQSGWQGVVYVKVLVSLEGKAAQVIVERSSGHAVLDESAAGTIRGWQFLPARIGNVRLSSWVVIPVRFQLTK